MLVMCGKMGKMRYFDRVKESGKAIMPPFNRCLIKYKNLLVGGILFVSHDLHVSYAMHFDRSPKWDWT
jgi:hypothetical protein